MTNTNVPQASKMEEGLVDEPVEHAVPAAAASNDKRLSTVSKAYDLSGKGELDDAQLAMRNMDSTGRGYLTNDKVYGMMQEQLKMQKSMFQMKKVIIGLLVFVVILALSNLGTSFASAILAKDSTTNDKQELVDKNSGEALATQNTADTYEAEPANGQTARKLDTCVSTGSGQNTELTCDLRTMAFTVPYNDAKEICQKCKQGRTVQIIRPFDDGSETLIKLCDSTSNEGTYGPGGSYCHLNAGINIDDNDDGATSTISGHLVTQDAGESCSSDFNCDQDLHCQFGNPGDGVQNDGAFIPALDECSVAEDCTYGSNPTCNLDTINPDGSKVKLCSPCDPATHLGCDSNSNTPLCVENGGGGYYCGCDLSDVNLGCESGTRCADDACIADVPPFCSADHSTDGGCATIPSTLPASATFSSPTATCGACSGYTDGSGCEEVYSPVCGSDGVTYCSDCHARHAVSSFGISIVALESCGPSGAAGEGATDASTGSPTKKPTAAPSQAPFGTTDEPTESPTKKPTASPSPAPFYPTRDECDEAGCSFYDACMNHSCDSAAGQTCEDCFDANDSTCTIVCSGNDGTPCLGYRCMEPTKK